MPRRPPSASVRDLPSTLAGLSRSAAALESTLTRLRGALHPSDLYRDVEATLAADPRIQKHTFPAGVNGPEAVVLFSEDMAKEPLINREIIGPLLKAMPAAPRSPGGLDAWVRRNLPTSSLKRLTALNGALDDLYRGEAIVAVPSANRMWSVRTENESHYRAISSPVTEREFLGPMDTFNEHLETNVALLRSRIPDVDLHVESQRVGHTDVAVSYLDSKVNHRMLANLTRRLGTIPFEGLLDGSQLARLLSGRSGVIFPTFLTTERPDKSAWALSQGRIVVLVANSPLAVLAPSIYLEAFEAMDDRYLPSLVASLWKLIRIIGAHVTPLAAAIYISIAQYGPGILPPQAILTLSSARAAVPYSPVVEMLLVLVLGDLIVEATVRSPKSVGNSIPIVGGIVIGTALLETHLASAPALILAAMALVAQFTTADPTIQVVQRAGKYWFALWASVLGYFGIIVATAVKIAYMCGLESLDVPYFTPIGPLQARDLPGAVIVWPRLTTLYTRTVGRKRGSPV